MNLETIIRNFDAWFQSHIDNTKTPITILSRNAESASVLSLSSPHAFSLYCFCSFLKWQGTNLEQILHLPKSCVKIRRTVSLSMFNSMASSLIVNRPSHFTISQTFSIASGMHTDCGRPVCRSSSLSRIMLPRCKLVLTFRRFPQLFFPI